MNSGTQPRWIPWARTGSCAAEHPLGQLIFTMIILGGQSSLQRARFDLCKVVVIAGEKVDVLQASYLLRSDHGAPPKIAPVPSSVTYPRDRCQPSRSCKGHFHFDCSRAWLERSFDVMRDLQNSLPYLASTCV